MLRWWKRKTELERVESDFSANLRIIHDYGAVSLDLQLVNGSSRILWVEEAVVVLADLDANSQTSIASGQACLAIRQNIRSNEMLELSPVNAIYDAAGTPQGKYSFLIYIDVRYRVDEEWCHKSLDPYKVQMGALMLRSLRHLSWRGKRVTFPPMSPSLSTPDVKHVGG